jgi:FolB domain-containing protein
MAASLSRPAKGSFYSARFKSDIVRVENLSVNVLLADGDRWRPAGAIPRVQPVYATVEILHDCSKAALEDNLSASINYGILSSVIIKACGKMVESGDATQSIEHLADRLAHVCFTSFPEIENIKLSLDKPKALLHASRVGYECSYLRSSPSPPEKFVIKDLSYHVIIGVNEAERVNEQIVRLDIAVERPTRTTDSFDYPAITRAIGTVKHNYEYYPRSGLNLF